MLLKIKNVINNFLEKFNFILFKKIFFLLSISYFIYYLIFNDIEITFELDRKYNYAYLLLAFLSSIFSVIVNGFAWKNIIIWFGENQKIDNLVSLYVLTNSLKYVPGGVWHFIERFNFLKNKINVNIASYAILIEPYFMLSSSLILVSLGIFYNPLFLFFLLPSIFLHSELIHLIIIKLESFKKKGMKILNINYAKSQFNLNVNIRSKFPLRIILIEILFILLKFISFIFCLTIFFNGNNIDYLKILIIFCLSWSFGLIIPAAPGGLGVFEGTFLFLVGSSYPQSIVISSLLVFRFISSCSDLLLSAPFFAKKFFKGN